jgi:putative membrane protein insertion efficiency factor
MEKLSVKAIKWYQSNLSSSKHTHCRHTPTCSQYAVTAFERFNFAKASLLTTKRILSCNPLFKPRFDPVPEKKVHKKKTS